MFEPKEFDQTRIDCISYSMSNEIWAFLHALIQIFIFQEEIMPAKKYFPVIRLIFKIRIN